MAGTKEIRMTVRVRTGHVPIALRIPPGTDPEAFLSQINIWHTPGSGHEENPPEEVEWYAIWVEHADENR